MKYKKVQKFFFACLYYNQIIKSKEISLFCQDERQFNLNKEGIQKMCNVMLFVLSLKRTL